MTEQELKDFLSTDEGKATFDLVAKSVGYESPDGVLGLKDNRDKLLTSERKLKDKIITLESSANEFDNDGYNEYLKNVESGSVDPSAKGKITRLETQLATEKETNNKLIGDINKGLISTEIGSALTKNNIDPKHNGLLMAAYSSKARVEEFEGVKSVIINDEGSPGLPASDYFEKWAGSDTGKVYLKQPENKGTNTGGFASATTTQTITREAFSKLNPSEQAAAAANAEVSITD